MIKSYPLDLYGVTFHVLYGDPRICEELARRRIKREFRKYLDPQDLHEHWALAYIPDYPENNDFFVYFQRDPRGVNIPTISHECYHTAMWIAESRGLGIDPEEDEHMAYLIAWLVSRCLDAFKFREFLAVRTNKPRRSTSENS